MSSTTPDSTVDPSPEDGTSNETDDVTTSDDGGNQEQDSGEPDVQLSGFNASELQKVKSAITSLQQRLPELKLDAVKIEKGDAMKSVSVSGYGGAMNGIIKLNSNFFSPSNSNVTKLSPNDQVAVLWHEIYHVQNNHNADTQSISIPAFVIPNEMKVPEQIEQKTREDIERDMPGLDSMWMEILYKDFLTVDKVRSSEFYENELETYGKEKDLFLDGFVSEGYQEDRDEKIWKYEIMLELAKKYNH